MDLQRAFSQATCSVNMGTPPFPTRNLRVKITGADTEESSILGQVGMPCQPILLEEFDSLWALDADFFGKGSVHRGLRKFYFLRSTGSPLGSVAITVVLGFEPWQSLAAFLPLLWFALLHLIFLMGISFSLHQPPSHVSVSLAVFCDCQNFAMRSGRSGFSPSSHPLLRNDFQRYPYFYLDNPLPENFSHHIVLFLSLKNILCFLLVCFPITPYPQCDAARI